jgi:hypothetical protein
MGRRCRSRALDKPAILYEGPLPKLARLRHADRHDQRPLPVEDRKTSALVEYSHFDPTETLALAQGQRPML